MLHAFYLAARHLAHHRARSWVLLLCLTLLATTPWMLHRLLNQASAQLQGRAAATPLLLGARGSQLDVWLHALYFQGSHTPGLTQADADAIAASGWADPLPLYSRWRIQDQALVGVTPDYFDWRGLRIAQGQPLTLLGECVVGARAAQRLNVQVGATLSSAPENPFELAGAFPLQLRVVGILEPSASPDDDAIFVDVKTAWLIDGIGHGHESNAPTSHDALAAFSGADATPAPSAIRISADNLASFHFHGDPATYPLSAVIAVPHDARAATLLRGRYLDPHGTAQMLVPLQLADTLLRNVMRMQRLFDAVAALSGVAALLALGLVFTLSVQLRSDELQTMHLLGCSRYAVWRLLSAEIVLLGTAALALGAALVGLAERYGTTLLIEHLLF